MKYLKDQFSGFRSQICTVIWILSERSGIGLGRLAPHIFGWMIESKPIKQ